MQKFSKIMFHSFNKLFVERQLCVIVPSKDIEVRTTPTRHLVSASLFPVS